MPNTLLNPNPTNYKSDCCDGGAFLGSGEADVKRLFIGSSCCIKWSGDLPVQAAQTFASGELAKIDLTTGAISKLTGAPVATDTLCLVVYALDNTTASVTAGKATPRASVVIEADGINQDAIILPASVTFNDAIKAVMSAKNLNTAKLV